MTMTEATVEAAKTRIAVTAGRLYRSRAARAGGARRRTCGCKDPTAPPGPQCEPTAQRADLPDRAAMPIAGVVERQRSGPWRTRLARVPKAHQDRADQFEELLKRF